MNTASELISEQSETTRTWAVRSASFKSDFNIAGENLIQAIEQNFGAIARDVYGNKLSGVRFKSISASYYPEILNRQGGVELVIDALTHGNQSSSERSVVWIRAISSDLPTPHKFKING